MYLSDKLTEKPTGSRIYELFTIEKISQKIKKITTRPYALSWLESEIWLPLYAAASRLRRSFPLAGDGQGTAQPACNLRINHTGLWCHMTPSPDSGSPPSAVQHRRSCHCLVCGKKSTVCVSLSSHACVRGQKWLAAAEPVDRCWNGLSGHMGRYFCHISIERSVYFNQNSCTSLICNPEL